MKILDRRFFYENLNSTGRGERMREDGDRGEMERERRKIESEGKGMREWIQ